MLFFLNIYQQSINAIYCTKQTAMLYIYTLKSVAGFPFRMVRDILKIYQTVEN